MIEKIDPGRALTEAVAVEEDAKRDLREAMSRAIQASIRRIDAEITLCRLRGEQDDIKWEKKLQSMRRHLLDNLDHLSPFVSAPLDTSWRRRIIGI